MKRVKSFIQNSQTHTEPRSWYCRSLQIQTTGLAQHMTQNLKGYLPDWSCIWRPDLGYSWTAWCHRKIDKHEQCPVSPDIHDNHLGIHQFCNNRTKLYGSFYPRALEDSSVIEGDWRYYEGQVQVSFQRTKIRTCWGPISYCIGYICSQESRLQKWLTNRPKSSALQPRADVNSCSQISLQPSWSSWRFNYQRLLGRALW